MRTTVHLLVRAGSYVLAVVANKAHYIPRSVPNGFGISNRAVALRVLSRGKLMLDAPCPDLRKWRRLADDLEGWKIITANELLASFDQPKPTKPAKSTKPEYTMECRKCHGTGIFEWVNNRHINCRGKCNRCNGTGQQSQADRRRNFGYDKHNDHPYLGQ